MARCRRVVLVGFMGAGKSTVALLLARLLAWRCLDLDDAIAAQAGTTVADIFTGHGEAHFRDLETRLLTQALAAEGGPGIVLAVGGGALEMLRNCEAIVRAPETRVFYLEAPLEALLARCAAQQGGPVRPLLNDSAILFERRAQTYFSVGTPVSTFGFSAEQVAVHIVSLLQIDNAL